MMNWLDILFFLTGHNCSDAWQGYRLPAKIIPMTNPDHKDVILMLSRLRDGVGSRLIRESNITVATIVAELHEILLSPIKWGKIRMTETVKGDKSPKGGVL